MEDLEVITQHAEGMKLWRSPDDILMEAKQAAVSLQRILAAKPKKVVFNGERYLELEDWLVLAQFYGYSTKIESTKFIDLGNGVRGYEASALLIIEKTGEIVGRAESMCLSDEENWGMRPEYEWKDVIGGNGEKVWDEKTKKYRREKVLMGEKPTPLFQIRSMAETRASAKALRHKLAWVAVLAGYQPTPAEEMDQRTGDPDAPAPLPATIEKKAEAPITPDAARYEQAQAAAPVSQPKPPQPAQQPAPVRPQPQSVRTISEAQGRRFYAIWKQSGRTKEEVADYLRKEFGLASDRDIPASRYEQVCAWAGRS